MSRVQLMLYVQQRNAFNALYLNEYKNKPFFFFFSYVQQERKAIVVLKGPGQVSGNVTFVQANRGGPVTLIGMVSGLTEGTHGFHIHEKGDLSNGCISTGPHFNPQGVSTHNVLYLKLESAYDMVKF